MKTLAKSLVLTSLLWSGATLGAHAQTRAWVSQHGVDSAGCGNITSPCRSFQFAHDSGLGVSGGEIDILDPGGYGVLSVSKPLAIINDGVGTAGILQVGSGLNALNAGQFDLYLRGVTIEGGAIGDTGVKVVGTGGSLTMEKCLVRNFVNNGVDLRPANAFTFFISETTVAENGRNGFVTQPQGAIVLSGVIDRSAFVRNGAGNANGAGGLYVNAGATAGNGALNVTISNSTVANNFNAGIYANHAFSGGASSAVMVRSTTVSNNGTGVLAFNGATVSLAHSVIHNNNQAIQTSNGGLVYTFGDNDIFQNASAGSALTPQGQM